jgi:hypothetical protein
MRDQSERHVQSRNHVSTDVEARSHSRPAFHAELRLRRISRGQDRIATFSANLETCLARRATRNHGVVAKNEAAWNACRVDCQPPEAAMPAYGVAQGAARRPVFVGYPAAYDFMFVYWYLMRFAGESPFSHSALDIKTLAMALMNSDYRDATKRNMPRAWFDKSPHTHVALDDALEQGALFCNMLAKLRGMRTGDGT